MDQWITRIPIREFSNLSLNLSEFGRITLESCSDFCTPECKELWTPDGSGAEDEKLSRLR